MRKDIIQNWANNHDITITASQLKKLEQFQIEVLETNKHMNLTGITDDTGFAVKHFVDSLSILPYIQKNAAVIDVGTGAGFPGIVIGIMRPDVNLTLLDSLKKRMRFIEETLKVLNLPQVECISERAEEWARTGARYNICTARAVAKMDKLITYALPLVKPGGKLLAMKGTDIKDELKQAEAVLKKFGGEVESIDTIRLSDEVSHSIVVVTK